MNGLTAQSLVGRDKGEGDLAFSPSPPPSPVKGEGEKE